MLRNPEGNGHLIRYNNDRNHLRWRERSRPVPQWARRTHLWRIRIRMPNEKEHLPIIGYDSRLCMFSYYQIHPTRINKTAGGPSSKDGVTAKVSETTCYYSIRTGSCLSFGAKLLRKACPKTPHHGFISSFLVLISTLGILRILSFMACHQLYVHTSSSSEGGECSLQDPREIHFKESLVLPRETALAFPREQAHVVSLHHLPTLTQNNWTLKFILTLTLHSLFALTRPLATSATTFRNLFQVAFDKRTKALQLQMRLVLVFKKGLSRFDSSTMQGHSMFSFWTTVCITQNCRSIFFPQDASQRNFSMPMGIQTKRLASNPDTQLMFLLGLLDSSRRHFRLQRPVFQSFFLTKAFERTNHFACNATPLMQTQLRIRHLTQIPNPQMLSLLKAKNLLERPHPQSAGTTKSQRQVGTRKHPKKKP